MVQKCHQNLYLLFCSASLRYMKYALQNIIFLVRSTFCSVLESMRIPSLGTAFLSHLSPYQWCSEAKVPQPGRACQPTPVFLPGESSWTEEPDGLQSLGVAKSWTRLNDSVYVVSILNKTSQAGKPVRRPLWSFKCTIPTRLKWGHINDEVN